MIKIVQAVLKLIESGLRLGGITGPNSRERVREKIVVVLNGQTIQK
jgi:hypothetical protein